MLISFITCLSDILHDVKLYTYTFLPELLHRKNGGLGHRDKVPPPSYSPILVCLFVNDWYVVVVVVVVVVFCLLVCIFTVTVAIYS